MYIVQFEDADPQYCSQLTDAEFRGAKDGYLTLIHSVNNTKPMIYDPESGEWVIMEEWKTHS